MLPLMHVSSILARLFVCFSDNQIKHLIGVNLLIHLLYVPSSGIYVHVSRGVCLSVWMCWFENL